MTSSSWEIIKRQLVLTLTQLVSESLILIFRSETKNDEPAYYTNRAIAWLKCENFAKAQEDCKAALRINPKFAKAYNRMSKCYIALGDLQEASMTLQKSIELEPTNVVNKKDQKHLADLHIIETLANKAIVDEKYQKAVTNLT